MPELEDSHSCIQEKVHSRQLTMNTFQLVIRSCVKCATLSGWHRPHGVSGGQAGLDQQSGEKEKGRSPGSHLRDVGWIAKSYQVAEKRGSITKHQVQGQQPDDTWGYKSRNGSGGRGPGPPGEPRPPTGSTCPGRFPPPWVKEGKTTGRLGLRRFWGNCSFHPVPSPRAGPQRPRPWHSPQPLPGSAGELKDGGTD